MDIDRLREKCLGYAECFDRIEKRVTLCATEAIDNAMSEVDPDWFPTFKEKELNISPKNKAIITVRQNSIVDLDFQAAIKLFLFRESKVDFDNEDADIGVISAVFKKYSLPETKVAERPSRFKKLVGDLVNRRNELSGHLSAAEINSMLLTATERQLEDIIFKYKQSTFDLISFLSYFPDIKGSYPESHFEYAKKLLDETEKKYNIVRYSALAVINSEALGIGENEFSDICRNIRVNTATVDGILYFETDDYKRTIQIIRAMIANSSSSDNGNKKPTIPLIIAAVCVLLIIALLLLLIIKKPNNNNDDPPLGSTPSQSQSSETPSSDKSSSEAQNSLDSSSVSSEPSSNPSSQAPAPVVTKIRGEGSYGELTFTIDQKLSNRFVFKIKNGDECDYSLGWVTPSEIVIETSASTYFGRVYGGRYSIAAGGSGQITVNIEEDIEGTIETITIQNILPLGTSGLPVGSNTVGVVVDIPITYYN